MNSLPAEMLADGNAWTVRSMSSTTTLQWFFSCAIETILNSPGRSESRENFEDLEVVVLSLLFHV